MSSENELLDFIREQIKVENEIVDSLNESLAEMVNPAVKGALKGISLDSVKHAEMYCACVNLLAAVPQALTEEQLDKQREQVEKDIRIEAALIKRISETMPNIKDEKIMLLLNAILSNEKRHHALLKEVPAILVKGETITDEEWFDVVWKGVLFHGAPGDKQHPLLYSCLKANSSHVAVVYRKIVALRQYLEVFSTRLEIGSRTNAISREHKARKFGFLGIQFAKSLSQTIYSLQA